jgi:hypothetical protein
LKRASNLPRRALATGLAACAHLVVLLLLGWKIPRLIVPTRSEDESPAIEVTLVRSAPRSRTPIRPETPHAAPLATPSPPRVLTAPFPSSPPIAAPAPSAPAPVPSNVEGSANDEHLRSALRGLLGCSSQTTLHLTSEERAACDRRLAAAAPAAVGPQLSAQELAGFNADKQESILTRKPVNGCLPRLGDHKRPGGAGGGPVPPPPPGAPHSRAATTAVGVGCGWSF